MQPKISPTRRNAKKTKPNKQIISQIRDPALVQMNYWEKLSHLRVYSQERRRERYQICFLWKQSQGLIEGYSFKWQWSYRRMRLAIPTNIPLMLQQK